MTKPKGSKLLLRADAGPQTGTGHVMRCLALAQAWQEEGMEALFVSAESMPALGKRLEIEGMQELLLPGFLPGSLEDAQETAVLAQEHSVRWIVIDGYHFGATYQKYLKDAGFSLLVWDDNGRTMHYYADFIINQNIYAEESLYEDRESYTQLLLGTSYAVLRREFWSWRGWEREISDKAKKVLVTMGGSDPDNVTLKVIRALQQIENDDLQVAVIVGGSNAHYPSLKAAIDDDKEWIQLQRNVTDMPSLMAWADMAISAAGSTCWELAFMGVPSLLLILAENQERAANYLNKYDIAVRLGFGSEIDLSTIITNTQSLVSDAHLRKEMSSRGAVLVDGFGVQRVISALSESG